MNNTIKSLLRRGIDSVIASKIVSDGYTITKIKSENNEELIKLGLTQNQINNIKNGRRPPIPTEVINQLLYESNCTCCICKNSNNGVVIHHIEEWHISKSHNPDNLIVLCPNHHDKAHSHSDLTLNMTKERLVNFKKEWIAEVKHKTSLALKEKFKADNNRYNYFNIKRLFELIIHYGITNFDSNSFFYLKEKNILDENGNIKGYDDWNIKSSPESYLFQPFECNHLYYYIKELMDFLLEYIDVKDLNNIWNKKDIIKHVHNGDFITFSGGVYFKRGKIDKGNEQPKIIYMKKKGVKVFSEINAFWATSSSAHTCFLTGHQSNTFIGQVLSIKNTLLGLEIQCSAIAIGNNFYT